MKKSVLLLTVFLLSGCTSVGTLGVVTKSTGDPGAMLRNGQAYKELGPVDGSSCRFFLLGVVPWGNGTLSAAVDDALAKVNGQAVANIAKVNGRAV